MKFYIYKDRAGGWRWRLKARNGRIVADSGEGYKTRAGAHAAAIRVARGVHRVVEEMQ